MPSGLVALLDDISVIAKAAAASIDDVGAAAAKAGSKAAGVVIDDAVGLHLVDRGDGLSDFHAAALDRGSV